MKVKGIILSLIVSLALVCMMPFSVFGETYESTLTLDNIVGVNCYTTENHDGSVFNNRIQIVFDDRYIGSATFKIRYRLGTGSYTTSTLSVSFCDAYAEVQINSSGQSIDRANVTVTQVSNAVVYKYSDFLWQFPYESMNFVLDIVDQGYDIIGFKDFGSYIYPVFFVPSGGEIISRYLNKAGTPNYKATIVLWTNKNISSLTSFDAYMTRVNCGVDDYVSLNSFSYLGSSTRIIKFTLYNSNGDVNQTCKVLAHEDMYIIPIYCKRNGEIGYETQDFCDNFGLPYNGLDNQAQESVDNLDDTMSDFAQASDDVISVENNIGSGFENSLEDIPTEFNFTNQFGASFISSAQWVRNQFNSMTVNNPFGSLITFSLILGVGLLLLGRKLL